MYYTIRKFGDTTCFKVQNNSRLLDKVEAERNKHMGSIDRAVHVAGIVSNLFNQSEQPQSLATVGRNQSFINKMFSQLRKKAIF